MSSLYAKLAGLALVLAGIAGFGLWCHHRGAASVQAQWDAAKAVQDQAVANAKASNAQQTLDWTNQFAQIKTQFEATTHAQAPSIADTVATGVAAGTVRLRDEPVCSGGGQVATATARSRAADAAATQALADRVQASIAAVRAGDEADARERLLGAQVTALQAVLKAERQP